jgi:hypothetical protein
VAAAGAPSELALARDDEPPSLTLRQSLVGCELEV